MKQGILGARCKPSALYPKARTDMAKCDPYHTITDEKQYGQRNVYHDYTDCPDGSRIETKNWAAGQDGRPRCDECKKLD